MKKLFALVPLVITCLFLAAEVKLPAIFSDGMVLQRDAPVNIWGWAKKNERIVVSLSNQVKTTKADKNGHWRIQLDPLAAGGPYAIQVKGNSNTIAINDVLVGDVWICSGQSNMEFTLDRAVNGKEEIANASYPQIRCVTVKQNAALSPLNDILPVDWKICSPQTAGKFSAAAYFFARKIQQEKHVPIGLVVTCWGGTNIEAWTSKEGLATHPDFKEIVAKQSKGDISQIAKNRYQSLTKNVAAFQNGVITNDTQLWKNTGYDDALWATLMARKPWEQQGLRGFDGVVWYRKAITVTDAQAKKTALLELPQIGDADETYINGALVGQTDAHQSANTLRRYNVPAGLLKVGKNVIAIKITDLAGDGGIVGNQNNLQLTLEGESPISLEGAWKARVDTTSFRGMIDPGINPSCLYNGMINPLIQYTIKGAIWYQGEANANRAYQYRTVFPLMINDWRSKWMEGNFPFYFVQLTTYDAHRENTTKGSKWAELRDAQAKALSLPNTGMAVTIDIGDPKDLHPKNKQDVGLRLALNALAMTYGKDITPCGPLYKSMQIDGNKIILEFTETGKGLVAKDKYGQLRTFEIAGADKQFKWAFAYIENNKVIVFGPEVANPVAVRYAWLDNAEDANLYNAEGLPASPFRTDDWEELTMQTKYEY